MADIAFVPQSHVLQRDGRIPANNARQATQPLIGNRVPLMRHRRAAFLAFTEKFFDLENFGPLEMTKLRSPSIDARSNHGKCSHKLGMPIALHDLSRKCR